MDWLCVIGCGRFLMCITTLWDMEQEESKQQLTLSSYLLREIENKGLLAQSLEATCCHNNIIGRDATNLTCSDNCAICVS